MTQSAPTTPPAIPSDIPEAVAVAAVETMLKAVGNPVLRYYMPRTQARAIEAMRGILAAERDQAADRVDAVADAINALPTRSSDVKLVQESQVDVLRICAAAIRKGAN